MPSILALERELFPDDAWTPEMFAAEFAQPASRRLYLVAEEGGALVGYAGMMFTGGPQADVLTLAVEPAHWGQGAGTALLSALGRDRDRFDDEHRRRYGYDHRGREVEPVTARVRAIAITEKLDPAAPATEETFFSTYIPEGWRGETDEAGNFLLRRIS